MFSKPLLFSLFYLPFIVFADEVKGIKVLDPEIVSVGEKHYLIARIENLSQTPNPKVFLRVVWLDQNKVTVTSGRYEITKKGPLIAGKPYSFKISVPSDRSIRTFLIKVKKGVDEMLGERTVREKKFSSPTRDRAQIKAKRDPTSNALENTKRKRVEQKTEKPILKFLDWRWYSEDNWIYVEGEVKNTSRKTIRSVNIIASFYRKNDRFLKSDDTYTELNTLDPGMVSPFKIMLAYDPAIAKVKLIGQCRFVD